MCEHVFGCCKVCKLWSGSSWAGPHTPVSDAWEPVVGEEPEGAGIYPALLPPGGLWCFLAAPPSLQAQVPHIT
jgi:hypothetical protein